MMMRNITLVLAATMTIMAGATIAPALPNMQLAFAHWDNAEFWVKLVLTIPALAIAISAIGFGALSDRFGRKPVLMASLVVYAAAGTSGYWLQSLEYILVGRALLGAAVAGIMTSTTALIGDYFKGPSLGKFMGIQTAVVGLGGFVFLSLGGMLAEENWRSPFALYLFSLVLLPLVFAFIKTSPLPAKKTQHESESQAKIAFNWFGSSIAFVGMVAFYMLPTQLPFLLSGFDALSISSIGFIIASMTLATSVASLFYGKLKQQFSFNGIFAIAFASLATGMFLIGAATSSQMAITGVVISGIGTGWLMPNLNVWFMSFTTPDNRGKVIGTLTTALFLGQFSSPIIVSPLQQELGLALSFQFVAVVLLAMSVSFGVATWHSRKFASSLV